MASRIYHDGGEGTSESTESVAVDSNQRKHCVVCDVNQPKDGKLLRCFHLMCTSCLEDVVARDGTLNCPLCPDIKTTASYPGVPLSKQLVASGPLLYPARLSEKAASDDEMDKHKDGVFCSVCEETDVICEASRQCNDCQGMPMCRKHAERHSKSRFYSGHQVSKLGRNSGQFLGECIYHSQNQVIMFCVTCARVACKHCLSQHHQRHAFQSLEAAASDKRSLLTTPQTQVLDGVQIAGSRPGLENRDIGSTLEASIKATSDCIGGLQVEAKEASQLVTDTFDKVERQVKEIRSRCLDDVNQMLWREIKPLQQQLTCLGILQQRQKTTKDVADHLLSEDCDSVDILLLADDVQANLASLSSAKELKVGAAPHLTAIVKPLSNVSKALESLVSVNTTSRESLPDSRDQDEVRDVDLVNTVVYVQHPCATGKTRILVEVRDKKDQPIPPSTSHTPVTATITSSASPDQTQDLQLSSCAVLSADLGDSTRTPLLLQLKAGDSSVSKPIVLQDVITFDPFSAPRGVDLQGGCSYAHQEDPATGVNVLASNGYVHGTNLWRIIPRKASRHGCNIACGVAQLPSDGNFHSVVPYFGGVFYACDAGGSSSSHTHPHLSKFTKPWKEGTLVEFALDVESRTLTCQHWYSSADRHEFVFKDIDCSAPLYPVLYLPAVDHAVEIY